MLPRYRRTADDDLPFAAPMTEPVRRRNDLTTSSQRSNGKIVRPKPSSNLSSGPRKSSYGDYDSELVDGKYITSVPIISMNDDDFNSNSNLRPKHRSREAGAASKGLSELSRQSSLRKTSLAERISGGGAAAGSPAPGRRATAAGGGGNVFNRCAMSGECLLKCLAYQMA